MSRQLLDRAAALLRAVDDRVESTWATADPAALVVLPRQRLPSWPKMLGMGAQHCVAMFGGTVLVPLITHADPACSLFFSGVGTLLFTAITANHVPSYLGSTFALVAPALASDSHAQAQSGFVATGLLFALIGAFVHMAGTARWIDVLMPPVVTGTVVTIIGLNLAPVAKAEFDADPLSGLFTAVAIIVMAVYDRGMVSRLSIFLGVVFGTAFAAALGRCDFSPVANAAWVGWPAFQLPVMSTRSITMCVPTVIVLIAENVGHIKAVAAMTEEPLDAYIGRAFVGDGLATAVSGFFGGSGTTTYAENIGVMAASRVYSTLVYVIASISAIVLSVCPKVGALVQSIPSGVIGGCATVLYGMIVVLGVKLFVEGACNFRHPVNLAVAGTCIVVGAADFKFAYGGVQFGGIGVGCVAAVVGFPLCHAAYAWWHPTGEEGQDAPAPTQAPPPMNVVGRCHATPPAPMMNADPPTGGGVVGVGTTEGTALEEGSGSPLAAEEGSGSPLAGEEESPVGPPAGPSV